MIRVRVRVSARIRRLKFLKESAIAVGAREVGVGRRREGDCAIALVAKICLRICYAHAGA